MQVSLIKPLASYHESRKALAIVSEFTDLLWTDD
jgi:hypothetical protein